MKKWSCTGEKRTGCGGGAKVLDRINKKLDKIAEKVGASKPAVKKAAAKKPATKKTGKKK